MQTVIKVTSYQLLIYKQCRQKSITH